MWESISTAQWLKESQETPGKHLNAFAFQNTLPRLPVPDLDATLDKFLETCKPILTPDEFKETLKAVEDFKQPNGFGRILQQRLLDHEKDCVKNGETNWLRQWWLQAAYLSDRTPIAVHSNVFSVSRNHPLAAIQKIDPVIRAAGIAHNTALYRLLLHKGDIPIDYAGKKTSLYGPIYSSVWYCAYSWCSNG